MEGTPEEKEVEYREIAGFPGYRVGDDGTVWTCRKRIGLSSGKGSAGYLSPDWRILKITKSMHGYARVGIYNGKKQSIKSVARLVLEAFVGECHEGMECCHKDGDRMNDKLVNLRWGTRKSNTEDRDRHGTTAHGERIGNSKLTAPDIAEIYKLRSNGVRISEIARKFRVDGSSIRNVLEGRTWKRVSEEFKLKPFGKE